MIGGFLIFNQLTETSIPEKRLVKHGNHEVNRILHFYYERTIT